MNLSPYRLTLFRKPALLPNVPQFIAARIALRFQKLKTALGLDSSLMSAMAWQDDFW